MQPQSSESFEAISQIIRKHLEDRDWHTAKPRDLATSISLETAELLEHYQWSDQPVGTHNDIAEELADILIYAFQFAQAEQIDIAQAIKQKLQKSAQKYPAHQFKGKNSQQRREAWLHAKKEHRKRNI